MAELKTKVNEKSVIDFLAAITPEQKSKDCFELAEMMKKVTGMEPKMWGDSIVGFGSYHYTYDSGHEGDMCLIGFSPRKQNITLYILGGGTKNYEALLSKLGKHKTSKSCLYINKLCDVDKNTLNKIIIESFKYMKNNYLI
jgi:hypothetical protein